MASWFLPAGEVILREDYGENKEPIVHRSKGYDLPTDELDMVILINQGSASASEILSGALHEYGIATLVGETSFGKGSVQELVDVTDETSLKVTIARWMTPNNISISDGGLEPEVVVEMTLEDIEAGRDPQLERALEVVKSL
jgi:carboxyl-terminal processing protease